MDLMIVVAGALIANMITVAFLYVAWRLNREGAENDVPGILMGIGVGVAIIVVALAVRPLV